jgi:outer membrane protein TolC
MLYKRVETAQLCFDATQAAYQAETVTVDQLITAMNNLVDAKLAVARTPQEEIAALEEHVKNTQNLEQKIKQLYDVGSRGGEADVYALAKFTRETAQISLLKARLKTKQ